MHILTPIAFAEGIFENFTFMENCMTEMALWMGLDLDRAELQNGQWKQLQHVVHLSNSGKDLPFWTVISILKRESLIFRIFWDYFNENIPSAFFHHLPYNDLNQIHKITKY